MNSIILEGDLASDPMIQTAADGALIASFTIECRSDAFGPDRSGSDFPLCVARGRAAALIRDYFHQGSSILAAGALRTGVRQDAGESPARIYEVEITHVKFPTAAADKGASRAMEDDDLIFDDYDPDFEPLEDSDLPF